MTKFYTTSEVAKICNVHRNTVLGAIRKGLIRIQRTPGGHARITQEALDEFIHRRSLPTTSHILRNNRVLLVDTDALASKNIQQRLTKHDYLVETAESAFEAGYLLSRFKPNLCVLRDRINSEYGHLLVRRAREIKALRDVHFIGLVEPGDKISTKEFKHAGVDKILDYPISSADLKEAIVDLIGPVVTFGDHALAQAKAHDTQDNTPTRRIERARLETGDEAPKQSEDSSDEIEALPR